MSQPIIAAKICSAETENIWSRAEKISAACTGYGILFINIAVL